MMGPIILPPPKSYIKWFNHLCLKKSSFLHTCGCTMPHTFFNNGKSYFQLRQRIAIVVWAQLFCDCQGEASPLKVVFHRRSSYTEGRLPSKIIFHQRLDVIRGRLSSNKGCLPPKVVFHQRLFSTKGCFPPKFVSHERSFSIEGHLLPKVVFH